MIKNILRMGGGVIVIIENRERSNKECMRKKWNNKLLS
jgi:hypothetical protein